MRRLSIIITLALLALPAAAADLTTADPPAIVADATDTNLRQALSRYLVLEMIRASFDVVPRDEVAQRVEDEALHWGRKAPDPLAAADLDRQLLAEASYYLVSLSYVVQVGGAAFPGDKAEPAYANDTLVRIDALQRQLSDAIANRGDVLPIMQEAERIRALTEGNAEVPDEVGVFGQHAEILNKVMASLTGGTQT